MSRLSSLSTSFPSPTSSPILIDSAVLFLIQAGYWLLSRRFLLHALPTLRQISKNNPDGADAGEANDSGILGLPGLAGSREDDEDGVINASGGLSDTGSTHGTNGGSRHLYPPGQETSRGHAHLATTDDLDEESDTDSLLSYAAGSPSPGLSNRASMDGYPLLPLHGQQGSSNSQNQSTASHHRPGSVVTDPNVLSKKLLAGKGKEVSIRPPSSSSANNNTASLSSGSGLGSNSRRGTEPRNKVLKLFHGRSRSARVQGDGERVRTTRGLGWLARNLFSLCFSECLLLLTLVMFHSIGILHSRSRRVHFSFSLHVLLLLILFVVPLVQCLQLTYRSRDSGTIKTPTMTTTTTKPSRRLTIGKRLLLSMIPFGIYVFLFTRIPPYVTTDHSNAAAAPTALLPLNNETVVTNGTRIGGGGRTGYKISLPAHVHLGDTSDLDEEETDETIQVVGLGAVEEGEDTDGIQEDWQRGGWLEPSLGRVVVCGIIIMGALSGFGAVRTAWGFYENGGLKSGRPVSREDIIAAERSLYRVRHDMMSKREHLSRSDVLEGATTRPAMARSASGWLDIFGSARSTAGAEDHSIRRELQGLELMEGQVKRSLEAMKLRRKRQRFARTVRGKVYNLIGLIFAFYCIARVLMCLTSVFFPPLATSHISHHAESGDKRPDSTLPQDGKGNTNGDWISYLIALALSQLPTGVVDVKMWSRAISLLLTGLLILASLAQVLRSVARILRLTSKSVGAGFLLLGLSQLMSTYVISLLIQMRSYIPPSTLDPDLSALPFNSTQPMHEPSYTYPTHLSSSNTSIIAGTIPKDPSLLATLPDFRVFGRLFDVMFVLAALSTGLWRYVGNKLNGPDEFGAVYHH